jgi:hypothetical protein
MEPIVFPELIAKSMVLEKRQSAYAVAEIGDRGGAEVFPLEIGRGHPP